VAVGLAVAGRGLSLFGGRASLVAAVAPPARAHGEVEPGGELVWETVPGNPFAVFGGMGGAGTAV
jgi:hypothetical protein